MDLSNLSEVWPLIALISFLVMVGFMRIVAQQIARQIEAHETARQAMGLRQEFLRRRQEQLQRQRELLGK